MLNDTEAWLTSLSILIERFNYLGIGADIASLTLVDLWALYLQLSRLIEG